MPMPDAVHDAPFVGATRRNMKASTRSQESSPFWRFSLGFYRQPGIAEVCIDLQERAGIDVNLLLFLLWQATLRRAVCVHEIEALEARIAPWRLATVVPLRSIRRALKSPPALVPAGTAELFRNKIKAVELEAERLQQEAMHALAAASPLGREARFPDEAARANIANYATVARAVFPERTVEVLLAALEKPRAQQEE